LDRVSLAIGDLADVVARVIGVAGRVPVRISDAINTVRDAVVAVGGLCTLGIGNGGEPPQRVVAVTPGVAEGIGDAGQTPVIRRVVGNNTRGS
jgi:hypothetical protein